MKSDMPLLSIIVPIYMVEEYLPQCIDSLRSQTYNNLEILLINDGSTNHYRIKYDEYIEVDARIKVFHKENGGFSDALNYGLNLATGEYIAFVDGDDYISNQKAFQVLLEEAVKSQADIIVGNYHKDMAGVLVPTKKHGFNRESDSCSSDFRFRGFFSVGHLSYTWGKLYKRSFIINHHLELKRYLYAQDKLFNVECYLHNPIYSFVTESVYTYRNNISSVSHNYKVKYAQIWISISEEIYRDITGMNIDPQCMDFVAYNLLFAVFFSGKQEYRHSGNKRKKLKEELYKFRSNDLMMQFIKEIVRGKYLSFRQGLHWKIFLWGLSVGLSLKLYEITSIAMKLLIDLKIDERLSSVGMVSQPQHCMREFDDLPHKVVRNKDNGRG